MGEGRTAQDRRGRRPAHLPVPRGRGDLRHADVDLVRRNRRCPLRARLQRARLPLVPGRAAAEGRANHSGGRDEGGRLRAGRRRIGQRPRGRGLPSEVPRQPVPPPDDRRPRPRRDGEGYATRGRRRRPTKSSDMKTATMRRAMGKAFGGPEQLTAQPAAEGPRPGPGQVLVDVEAAGVNYLDVMQRKGTPRLPLPYTPGLEGVGRVRETGEGADATGALAIGRRVAWINVLGSYAGQVVVAAAQAIPVPDCCTIPQALLFQAVTAQYLAGEYRDVRPGDRVLVHSAAGGVGQLLVQWLKHLGAWVVGTTSSDAKAVAARAVGADAVIDYGRDYAFLDELMSLTDGRGVDLAFDAVGAATLAPTLKAFARGGIAVSFGSASGPRPAIDPMQLINPCTRVAGGSLFSYIADPAELQR